MLAKKFRLTSNVDFKKVQSSGKTFQFSNMGIAVFERGDTNPPRFGFVISTKIAKDAVDRNTIRRHMSETVRLMTNDIKNGIDVVFLAKTSIVRVPAETLVREVRQSIKDSGLIR